MGHEIRSFSSKISGFQTFPASSALGRNGNAAANKDCLAGLNKTKDGVLSALELADGRLHMWSRGLHPASERSVQASRCL